MSKRVAVIGAGPAGMTAAYVLTKSPANLDVNVYEASEQVGGLSRSLRLWNQIVDLGPHRFFSRDRRVNSLWLEVVGRDYVMVPRLTRILYQGRYFQYPLQAMDALQRLGPLEATRCVASYGAARFKQPKDYCESFESWVTARFGRRLYEIFFRTYSEKLWGIPCSELDSDFAAQRIRKLSLGAALKQLAVRRKNNEHRTLVDRFAYPNGGTGQVYERMAEMVQERGGRVHLGAHIKRVVASAGRVRGIELYSDEFVPCDAVISSMPLTSLIARLNGVPERIREMARRLSYRNTILVYLEIAGELDSRDNWVYVQDPGLTVGRITNFRNWSPSLYGNSPNTILALEYWCNSDDELWRRSDGELGRLGADEFRASRLASDAADVLRSHVVRIPKSYPVYQRGYKDILRPIQEVLRSVEGLQAIGRYGAFKYNNQDHSILMGILAAENVAAGTAHDLWQVNSDFEEYQEACRIDETGLVPAPC
ncbi:MAG: UDP-galactopyranose mutase [Planctomycetaceae bacterium]|nr:UDP-galactopyranose mutase [Planctomycetaceae bacterium]